MSFLASSLRPLGRCNLTSHHLFLGAWTRIAAAFTYAFAVGIRRSAEAKRLTDWTCIYLLGSGATAALVGVSCSPRPANGGRPCAPNFASRENPRFIILSDRRSFALDSMGPPIPRGDIHLSFSASPLGQVRIFAIKDEGRARSNRDALIRSDRRRTRRVQRGSVPWSDGRMSAPRSQSAGGTCHRHHVGTEMAGPRDLSGPPVSPPPSPPMNPCCWPVVGFVPQNQQPDSHRLTRPPAGSGSHRPSRRQWAAKSQTWTESPTHAGHGGDGRTGGCRSSSWGALGAYPHRASAGRGRGAMIDWSVRSALFTPRRVRGPARGVEESGAPTRGLSQSASPVRDAVTRLGW
jgi:hypothetical protein